MNYRSSRIIAVLFFAALGAFCFSTRIYADGTCFSPEKVKGFFDKAVAAEKSGRLKDAFVGYDLASLNLLCSGQKNPFMSDANKGRLRIGKLFAAEEEKNGRLYSNKDIAPSFVMREDCYTDVNVTHQEKPSDVGVCIPESAGAFYWFSRVNDFANADRVMMKMFRTQPENMETFKIVYNHFSDRNDRKEDLKKEFGYTADPLYMAELKKTALLNANNALLKEEQEFNRKEIDIGGSPTSRSLDALKNAQGWMALIEGKKKGKVMERAVMRGDFLSKNDQIPSVLDEAIHYYTFAGNREKIDAVKTTANRLGDSFSKKGMTIKAREYYQIAGNKEKAKELDRKMKDQARESAKEFKKGFLKDEKGKQKFKKEQDDLEKELGM